MFHRAIAATLASCLVLLAVPALAIPPLEVSYQGYLIKPNGRPVNGTQDELELRIYQAPEPTGGEVPLYVERHFSVQVVDGVFDLLLGGGLVVGGSFDEALFDGTRFLEVLVNGDRMAPRQLLASVPSAHQAVNAAKLQGMTWADIVASLPEGPPGPEGAEGPEGQTGPPGPQGDPGADGAAGADGAPGADGAAGADGAPGVDGAPGADGVDGAPGADGLPCWDLNGDGSFDSATEDQDGDGLPTAGDCTGPQGDIGPEGPQGATGSSAAVPRVFDGAGKAMSRFLLGLQGQRAPD
jgi:hypothetical protein